MHVKSVAVFTQHRMKLAIKQETGPSRLTLLGQEQEEEEVWDMHLGAEGVQGLSLVTMIMQKKH